MTKDEILALLEQKADADFVIRTTEDEQTFLENYAKEAVEKGVKSYEGKLHQKYDDDFYTLTGKRRPSEMRTFDFIKNEWTAIGEKAQLADQLLREKQELEQKIKEGSTDKKLVADLEQVRKEYQQLKEESENKIKTIQTEHERFKIRNEILKARSELSFNDKIPDAAREALVERVVNELVVKAEMRDGKLFFVDEEGNPMRNKNNALNPYSAKELLNENLRDILKEKRKESGPAISDEIHKKYDNSGKLTEIALVVPDSIKTRELLGEFLVEKGLLRGTPEYYAAYKQYGEKLPVR